MPQRAEIMELLSAYHRAKPADSVLALQCLEQAYFLLNRCKLIDIELGFKISLYYSRSLISFGRTDESLSILFKALTQAEVESHQAIQEELWQEIALTYYTLGDYPEAGAYWAHCFLDDRCSDAAKLNAHIGMGMIQFAYGQIEQALVQHQLGISLLRCQMPAELHARVWINLASAFFQLNRWHESQHALIVAFPFAQQAQNQEYIGEIYIYLAKIALETNNLDLAKQRLGQAQANCNEWYLGDILHQLLQGRIFAASDQLDEAIVCFSHALEKASEMGSTQQMMEAHHLLCMAYRKIGNKERAEYEHACYQAACIRMKRWTKCSDEYAMPQLRDKPVIQGEMLHCA
jgi:tetratricopeptide (TPR) repeat protein